MSIRSNSYVYDIWNFSLSLPDTQLTIRGHSRGSERSCFYIPELKVFFDAGIQSYYNPDYIFITHCHSDHSFQLPMILTGLNRDGKQPPLICTPKESQRLFQNFIGVSYQLRKGTERARGHFKVTGVDPGDEIDLKKNGHFVRVYQLHHNVPTRGYGICQNRKKLNPEYVGLSVPELKKLKESGVDINIITEYNFFAYLCDTNIKCFYTNPDLLKYKYIMIECTFFQDEDMNEIEHHIHWNDLRQIVKENPNVTFILIHFSMRYHWQVIIDFFDKEKEKFKNIIAWVN